MGEITALINVVGVCIGIIASVLVIFRHFKPESKPRILNPLHQSESGGRYVEVSGVVPKPKRRVHYWVAIQPSDCRGDGLWWPQNERLRVDPDSSWNLPNVRLGRRGPAAADDIDKWFTIGLFEVSPKAQEHFQSFGSRDAPTRIPSGCRLLNSVEVRRVGS